jgi:hypothetical protein
MVAIMSMHDTVSRSDNAASLIVVIVSTPIYSIILCIFFAVLCKRFLQRMEHFLFFATTIPIGMVAKNVLQRIR